MTLRHTIRGLLIKDRKILLVTGHAADFYWTPGGGTEAGETVEETLRREIREELGVEISSMIHHSSYQYADQQVENYRIEIEGEIMPGNEITGIAWFSSDSTIIPSNGFKDTVLPQLLAEDLIN